MADVPTQTTVEPAMDPVQQSLFGALRTGFNVLLTVMGVLMIAYLLSGLFRIDAGEQGLIVRFGKLVTNSGQTDSEIGPKVFTQGLEVALPDPFDEKIRVPTRKFVMELDTFSFQRDEADRDKPLSQIERRRIGLKPGLDGALLTGDKNLAHAIWKIEYNIFDAQRFIEHVRADVPTREGRYPALEEILGRLAESVIITESAWRRFEDITRGESSAFAAGVRRRLQSEIDALDLGVALGAVTVDTAEPQGVRNAYRGVTQAENELKEQIDNAQAEANAILNKTAGAGHTELLRIIRAYGAQQAVGAAPAELAPVRGRIEQALDRSGGEVAIRLRDAASAANEIRQRVEGQFSEFQNRLKQYRKYPRITTLELQNQMRRKILTSLQNEMFFVPDVDDLQILLNRDPNKKARREMEALQKSPR